MYRSQFTIHNSQFTIIYGDSRQLAITRLTYRCVSRMRGTRPNLATRVSPLL